MTLAMPEIQQDGLDVSAEEERYLRRAFRRFALPYLLGTLALAGLLVAGGRLAPRAGDSTAAELETLVAEAAALREAVAAVRSELRAKSADATTRLDALEGGVAKLRASTGGESAAELGSRLDHAHQRITALEGRLQKVEGAALSARRETPPARAEEPGWPPAGASLP